MRYSMCTIYDSKAEAHMRPNMFRNEREAVKIFDRLCNDPQTDYSKFPQDYQLYHIGDFEDTKGLLIPVEPVVLLANGIDLHRAVALPYQTDVEDTKHPATKIREKLSNIS